MPSCKTAEPRFGLPGIKGDGFGSPLPFPSVNGLRSKLYPRGRLESREWVRVFVVLGALSIDLLVLTIGAIAAAYLRYGNVAEGNTSVLLLMMLPAFFFASLTFDAYSLETLKNWARSGHRANMAFLTAVGFAFTAAFVLHVSDRFSRLETVNMLSIGVLFLILARSCEAWFLSHLRAWIDPSVFILGDETVSKYARVADDVVNIRRLGWRPSADNPDFLHVVSRKFRHADRVLLAFSDPQERIAWASFMRLTGINTELLEPQFGPLTPFGLGQWGSTPTLVIARGPLTLCDRVAKRVFDLAVVVLLAPAAAPLVAILAVLIKWESPGPCFFSQDRVGRKNGRYRCHKLRTMRTDALDLDGDRSTGRDDARVTRLGRFLRRTSLDELPQLWNVFIGDMSVVGPRPHALGSTAGGTLFWQAVNGYWTRHAMKPGLTGLAQVRGFRGATHSLRDIEQRISADLEYVNSWSMWLDVRILLKTPLVMVHKNAF